VLDVRFVLADDLILRGLAAFDIYEMYRGAEDDSAARAELSNVDDLGIRELGFDITDARLDHTLLLLRRMIFRVFLEITMIPRLRDRRDDARALFTLQPFPLFLALLGPTSRKWNFTQTAASPCRSCNRFTTTLSR